MSRGLHHYVATTRKVRRKHTSLIDKLVYFAAVAEPLANLPQIYAIYGQRTAAGVSITSWMLYAMFATIWLWYGLHTKQKPMIVASMLFLSTDLTVVVGALVYGGV